MSSIFINGAQYAISTARSAIAVAITAISNAAEAVATTAAPPEAGAIVSLESGWQLLNEQIARAKTPLESSFVLEGVDTTDLLDFPASEGVGAYRVHSNFVTLDQLRDVQYTGGEQQYFQYQYVEDKAKRQRQKPTFKNAEVITLMLDYDHAKPWYTALQRIDRLAEPVVLRQRLPNGVTVFNFGYPSFGKNAKGGVNENLQNTFALSLIGEPIRFDPAA